jgi:hypothetical protein
MFVRLAIEIWGIGYNGTNRRGGKWVGEWGKQCRGCWFLWSLCVFGYISVIVVEGACVMDCKGLALCKVGIVGCSAGDECVGGME